MVISCMSVSLMGRSEFWTYSDHLSLCVLVDGPLSVNILGPDSAKVDTRVSLVCSADSRPDCDFHWFFNNQSSVLKAGSVLTFPALKKNEGNYICKARNPVTNITLYQTKAFTVGEWALLLHLNHIEFKHCQNRWNIFFICRYFHPSLPLRSRLRPPHTIPRPRDADGSVCFVSHCAVQLKPPP